MTYFIGQIPNADLLGSDTPRYFYALRRTDDGLLYFAKIDQLKWHIQAQQRRTNFHHWISRIKDVCAMFKETSSIMPKETSVPYQDKKCIGNRALYQLILSKVDNHCRDLLRHCNEEGDTALELLFVKCANITGVDTDHYHQLFRVYDIHYKTDTLLYQLYWLLLLIVSFFC